MLSHSHLDERAHRSVFGEKRLPIATSVLAQVVQVEDMRVLAGGSDVHHEGGVGTEVAADGHRAGVARVVSWDVAGRVEDSHFTHGLLQLHRQEEGSFLVVDVLDILPGAEVVSLCGCHTQDGLAELAVHGLLPTELKEVLERLFKVERLMRLTHRHPWRDSSPPDACPRPPCT